jgi:hypothetical protein
MYSAKTLDIISTLRKDVVRTIHGLHRDDRLEVSRRFIGERFSKLIKHFASGQDVDPARIHGA